MPSHQANSATLYHFHNRPDILGVQEHDGCTVTKALKPIKKFVTAPILCPPYITRITENIIVRTLTSIITSLSPTSSRFRHGPFRLPTMPSFHGIPNQFPQLLFLSCFPASMIHHLLRHYTTCIPSFALFSRYPPSAGP